MTDDELDQALFALPLAAPPPGMREHILAMTSEAAPAPGRFFVLGAADIAGIAVILAIATWLVVSGLARTFLNGPLLQTVSSLTERVGGETTLLVWCSVGASIAAILSYTSSRFDRPLTRS